MVSQITTSSLQSIIEKEGAVVLARRIYDQLVKKIEEQKQEIARIKQETKVDQMIAQGEAELKEGKTIIASSSEEALKKYYAR